MKVKPLVWYAIGSEWRGYSAVCAPYEVEPLKDGSWRIHYPGDGIGHAPTLDEAKAYCQRDLEERIADQMEPGEAPAPTGHVSS